LDRRQAVVITLAEKLGRGANSVAMKLCNLASLDPALKLRGIKGLPGASALDRATWKEFHDDLNETVPASEEALRALFGAKAGSDLEVVPKVGFRVRKLPPTGDTEAIANVKVRRGQQFFRNAVINHFGGRCAVTGMAMRELLVASHILPWRTHPTERLNVLNGISLSRMHDAAFDVGLISFDSDYRLILSPKLNRELSQRSIAENFGAYAGEPLLLPADAAFPKEEFLAEHRTLIFSRRA
jgi:putative restriction endonuclease